MLVILKDHLKIIINHFIYFIPNNTYNFLLQQEIVMYVPISKVM